MVTCWRFKCDYRVLVAFQILFAAIGPATTPKAAAATATHPGILVEHAEENIRGVYEFAGTFNESPAFEDKETRSAIVREIVDTNRYEWVLGSIVPTPALICSSSSSFLANDRKVGPPIDGWRCNGTEKSPIFTRLDYPVVDEIYAKARAHQMNRRPVMARILYRAALLAVIRVPTGETRHSLHVDILLGLGRLNRHFGNLEEAAHYLKQCKSFANDRKETSRRKVAFALSILGSVYTSMGRFEDALSARVAASHVDDKNPNLWRSIGDSLSSLRRHDEALQAFAKARGILVAQNVSADAMVPSAATSRSPLLWALVLQGIGESHRELGSTKDSIDIWNEGVERGIWPNVYRRFVRPWAFPHEPNGPIPRREGRDAAVVSRRESCNAMTSGDRTVRYPVEAVELLESNFESIRNEVLGLLSGRGSSPSPPSASSTLPVPEKESEGLHRGANWTHLRITEKSEWSGKISSLLPFTSSVLRSIRSVRHEDSSDENDRDEEIRPYDLCALRKRCPSELFAQISQLEPGTNILPHCGPTNLRLRIHLPLRVPSPQCCGIRVRSGGREGVAVDESVHYLQEGQAFVFDDSFEHEAWYHREESDDGNVSSATRVVLIVDVWHPDVPLSLIRFLHRRED